MGNASPIRRPSQTLRILVAFLILLAVVAVVWGRQIQREILVRLVLRSDAPSQTTVDELADSYPDPVPFATRLMKTGKVAHRLLAMEELRRRSISPRSADPRVDGLLAAGAADPDASVRELALAALSEEHSPLLFEAARAQLNNSDPQVRLLGVQQLTRLDAKRALPCLIPLLDDADPRVITAADSAMRRWTGIDFGVRIAQSVPKAGATGQETLNPEDVSAMKAGVEKRKAWWEEHKSEFTVSDASAQTKVDDVAQENSLAADFVLPDLKGNKVRLSQLRGKTVLLNFWATWCTACVAEIPDLIELQKRHANELVVLGISLDGVPDEHGHTEGHAESEVAGAAASHEGAEGEMHRPSFGDLQAKVARVVTARHMTYSVLLDPGNVVGSQYNGGELPTNVLIDSAGKVRRRFVGARPLNAWEAMIKEVAHGG